MAIFRRRHAPDPDAVLEPVPDDLPKGGLFREPIVVTDCVARDVEAQEDGRIRVVFRVVVRDADGKRCPDLHVEAEITGPERTGRGGTTTDLLGAATFRMTGPPGSYAITVRDVAAGALVLDRDASSLQAQVDA